MLRFLHDGATERSPAWQGQVQRTGLPMVTVRVHVDGKLAATGKVRR
jgi:hypothetical protein